MVREMRRTFGTGVVPKQLDPTHHGTTGSNIGTTGPLTLTKEKFTRPRESVTFTLTLPPVVIRGLTFAPYPGVELSGYRHVKL